MTTKTVGTAFSGINLETIPCPTCLGSGDLGIPKEMFPDHDVSGCPDCDSTGRVLVPSHVAEGERRREADLRRRGLR